MARPHSNQWLLLCRTVRFGDTDAAGVMHFHQLLRWCHEAWEESLERFGIPAAELFPAPLFTTLAGPAAAAPTIALPIVQCTASYRRPLICGDSLAIALSPSRLDPTSFEVHYNFHRTSEGEPGEEVGEGLLRHAAISATSRKRCPLPEGIQRWLEASALDQQICPLKKNQRSFPTEGSEKFTEVNQRLASGDFWQAGPGRWEP